MIKKIFSISFYTMAVLILAIYGVTVLSDKLYLSEYGRIFLLCSSCTFLYFGGLLLSKYKKDIKPMRINLWIFFGLYLLLFITLTLLDKTWGRNGLFVANWSSKLFNDYINNFFNIVPFKTIAGYIGMFDSLLDTRAIMFNLLGNIVACMPFAFFLPLLFEKQNNAKRFTLTMVIIVLVIELLQFATLSGSCDIDDIILNVSGALIMYAILKIKSVNNLIKNIFLLEKNKISIKSIIMIIICTAIILALGVVLVKLRQKVYDNNYNELISTYNFTIKIVDESEVTAQALEKFYEDEYHTYYFGSIKSDYVYAIINGNEKYLVKDLLNNNPTKYKITISKLEDAGLKFITENKYKDIILKGNGDLSPKIKIKDTSILEIGYGKSNSVINGQNIDESYYEMQFFIVPLKTGTTEFEIELVNNKNNEIVSTEKYKVVIDEDLKVNYEKQLDTEKSGRLKELEKDGYKSISIEYINLKEREDFIENTDKSVNYKYSFYCLGVEGHIKENREIEINGKDIGYKLKDIIRDEYTIYIITEDNYFYSANDNKLVSNAKISYILNLNKDGFDYYIVLFEDGSEYKFTLD